MKAAITRLSIFSLLLLVLVSCKKDAEMPTGEFVNLKTNKAAEIKAISAVVSATTEADCSERGVCWGKNPNPTVADFHIANGKGKGEYTCTLTDLEPDQKYYYRAYAKDGQKDRYVYANDEKNFTTKNGLVTLTTAAATNIGSTYATLGGVINDNNGMPILERGVCYGLEPGTSIEGLHAASTDSTNTFSVALTELENETLYYCKAYVKPQLGSIVYGEELTFTTLDGRPVVSTRNITDITATSAKCSGEVTDEGHASVTERGICWSKNASPTLDDFHIASGDGTGSFEIELTGLEPNTTYHVWAYATNALGTRYGEEKTFATKDGLPSVTTGNVTGITATSATCSGNVTDDGGFAVTERGICWSKNANPTLDNAGHITSGGGIGSFSVPLTGLEEFTTYHVRAYAVNSNGTPFYGEDVTFGTFSTHSLTFTANGVSFTMMPVEGGTFTMGATAEQGSDAYDNEYPEHSVTLSSYHMGETEVTQALWQAVMGSNPSYFSGSNLPVEQVSWNDCQEFITKLNQQCAGQLNGRQFRLPTEAEWEYAARGGNQSQGYKYSGSNNLGDVAWYCDNSGSTTHAVGTKQANELGLYDMSGNVWEWCSDWYGSYGSSAQTDPTGPATGSNRVRRGGSWLYYAGRCRVSRRSDSYPGDALNFLGLRLSLR